MYQYTPCAPVRTHPENRTQAVSSSHKTDLQSGRLLPYAYQAVRATGQQTAKLRDFNPTYGGNTANTQGGFFSPVVCAQRLKPGMRGLQHGENRNKRVVSVRTIEVPGNICPIQETYEYETMNASISMGAPAHNPLQALARLLPAGKPSPITTPPKRKPKAPNGLQLLIGTDGNITAYHNSNPVAWIIPGFHRSTETGLRCEFVDVAYHRKTRNGINMETADFDTLEQAVAFVSDVFGGAV